MALPKSGPFRTVVTTKGPATSLGYRPEVKQVDRTWWRQKRPYDLPLPFKLVERAVTASSAGHSVYGEDGSFYTTYVSAPSWVAPPQEVYNRAYEKLKENIGSAANWSASLAERRQAMDMMTSRISQIWRFTRALRKGRFGDAADALKCGLPPKRGRRLADGTRSGGLRRGAKYFANNYLEFHFGWSPLISDIYGTAELLSDGVPVSTVVGRAKRAYVSENSTSTRYYADDMHITKRYVAYTSEVQLRVQVSVQNPNLHLANSLGLVNPALVVWEVIPFSFVVDWFVNVGDFLSSFTDFAGLKLENPHETHFTRWQMLETVSSVYNRSRKYTGTTSGRYDGWQKQGWSGVYNERYVRPIAGPTLKVRDPWVVSPRRGLAAISLLIQALKH